VTSTPILVARSLTMWRGDRRLFVDLDVAIHAGRVLHVRGANGFGKTTLLRILSGLLPPEEGALTLDGEPFPSARARANATVGYLGHIDGLKLDLSAMENLRFAVTISGAAQNSAQAVDAATDLGAVMARVGLRTQADVLTRHLSAGQRRRLAIARLISGPHRLWVLDEPFTALDDSGIELLCDLMRGALERGVGIVMSSHQSVPLNESHVDVLVLGHDIVTPRNASADSNQHPAARQDGH